MLMVLVIAAVVLGSTGLGAAPSGGQITTLAAGEHLPWRAWLLVDPNGEGQSTSSSPGSDREEGRRITPKSLFIAPAFSGGGSHYELPECAEGYRADKLGRCVKLVRVNQASQRDFLLSKLSAFYTAPAPETQTVSQSTSSGPLQVSLPIAAAEETDGVDEEDSSKDSSVEVAVVMADVLQENSEKQSPSQNPQTILALWNIASNGTLADKETSDIQPGDGQLPPSSSSTSTTATMTTNKPHQLPNDDRQLLLTPPTAILTLKTGGSSRRNASSFESAGQMMGETASMSNSPSVMESTHEEDMPEDEPINDFIEEAKNNTQTNYSEVKSDLKLNSTNDSETNSVDVLNVSNTDINDVANKSRTNVNNKTFTTEREKSPNSFVRFPSDSNVLDPVYMHAKTSSSSNTMVRFPDSSRSSSSVVFPHDQSSIGHTETFWWLPPGWRLDETRHKPMLLRFWARVPLLRDPVTDSMPLHHPQVLDETKQRQQRMLGMHGEANANLQRPTRS